MGALERDLQPTEASSKARFMRWTDPHFMLAFSGVVLDFSCHGVTVAGVGGAEAQLQRVKVYNGPPFLKSRTS